MKAVLLTLATDKHVPGGVEVFSNHLKEAFPGLEILPALDYAKTSFFPAKEPLMAKYVANAVKDKLSKADVIFSNGLYGSFLPKQFKNKHINICHGTYAAFATEAMGISLDFLRTRYIYSFFEKKAMERARLVIANSYFTKDLIKKYYGVDCRVIHNAVGDIFRPIKDISLTDKYPGRKILFVGRPTREKGFDILVRVARKRPDDSFLCITYPKAISPEPNIHMIGTIKYNKVPSYYSSCDALLMPSRFEGFGYSIVESLACNTPVVSFETGIAKELNIEGLVKIGNLDAELFSKALDSPPKNINSNPFIRKKFSLNNFKRNYQKIVLRGEKY